MASIIEEAKFTNNLYSLAPHTHNCYELIYIKEGELKLTIASKEYSPKAPALIFVSKLEQHSLSVISGSYKRYYLCISPLLAGSMINDYTLLTVFSNRPEDFCHVLDVTSIEDDVERIFTTIIDEHKTQYDYCARRQAALLSELLVLIYRLEPRMFSHENDKSISVIWQIQCRLEQSCNEHLTLSSIANEYHMSPCYLSHLFKKVTGYPLMQYLSMCRLSLARQLLTETDMSITEIVFAIGYSDSSNFSRLFKREVNMTPMEYRRKFQK